MGVPFALSIHHFVNSVGADAGFASIIGLAILIFLFFAQMRETATLREDAETSEERVRQLEGRLNQVIRAQAAAVQAAQQQAVQQQTGQPAQPQRAAGAPGRYPRAQVPGQPAPRPAPAGAPAPAPVPVPAPGGAPGPAAVATPRVAPAGVGAPALSAATKLIPTDPPSSNGGGVAAPPRPVTAPAPVPMPSAVPFDLDSTPAPVTPAGAVNGGSTGRTGPPPRVQLRGTNASPPGRRPPPPSRPSSFEPEERPSSIARTVALGVAALVVIVILVIVLISLTGGNSSKKATTTPASNLPAPGHKRKHKTTTGKVKVNPSNVTVAVLNGTATSGLAQDVADRLENHGFKHGAITNATEQTHTTSLVAYLPGVANKNAALAVAQELGLSSSDVHPIDSSTQTIACGATDPCPPTSVVVTVGSDLSSDAGSAAGNTGSATVPAGSATVPSSTTTTVP